MNGPRVTCDLCRTDMTHQSDKLDLGWVGDGTYARDEDFRGILADIYSCDRCGHVAIRPVQLQLTRHGAHAA
jgi:hypothetical protein